MTTPAAAPSEERGALEYHFVETSLVTDEELSRIVNTHCAQGWHYEGTQFAMRESSKRPAMAFVLFTRARGT